MLFRSSAGSQVTIQKVSQVVEYKNTGLQALGAYQISIDDQITFENPLEIKIKYDPELLVKDFPAQDQLFAAYLDETSQEWIETDFILDEATSTVSIHTDHLTCWGLFGIDETTVISYSPHYKIYFDNKTDAPLLTDKPGGADLMYEFAALVRTALMDAYARYDTKQGSSMTSFKLPEMTKVFIYAGDPEDTAEWGWFSKHINIPNTYSDLATLNQDLAHEVFHSIQNQYVYVTTMNSNRWWMESTADYAAAYIGTSNGLKSILALDYIKKPIDLMDANDEQHLYGGAHFIKYMSEQGVNFKDLFDATMIGGDSSLILLEQFLNTQNSVMADLFAGFAKGFFYGGISHKASANGTIADLADYQADYERAETKDSIFVPVPGHYSARLAIFRITDAEGVTFPVFLSSIEPSSLVQVSYAIATSNSILETGMLHGGDQPVKVDVQDGNFVYFVVTNAGDGDGSTTVVIEKPSGVTSYEYAFESKIYNGWFSADVSFSLSSTAPFEIIRETLAPNGETFVLQIRLPAGTKGVAIDLSGITENIQIADLNTTAALEPSIHETRWVIDGNMAGSGGEASYFIQPGFNYLDITYEVYIDVTYLDQGTTAPFGSGIVIMIAVSP